jgi:hypothetical protein
MSEPVSPDVRPYAGQRHCLYCLARAQHDVGGFLACDDMEHIARALTALRARREQEDAMEEGVAGEVFGAAERDPR